MPAEPSASLALAQSFLRDADRERYLATLFLPARHRPYVVALYSFGAEMALIASRVSEPAPGEIRLQWWADLLEGRDHGTVRANPVADALLQTLERYTLPAGVLLRLINARRFDLYQDPMPDIESFEGYAGETNSTLLQLAAIILNDGSAVETGDAAGHLGVAQALVGHLRAFGFNAARGRIVLPWPVFEANGVTDAEILSGQGSEGLVEAFGHFSDMAREHLGKAEAAIAVLPATLRPAFAGIAVARLQLERLAAGQDDLFATSPDIPDWRKLAAMAWWTLRR